MVQGKQSQQNKPNHKAGGGMAKPSKAKEGGAAAKPKHSKSAGPAGTSKGGAKAERTSKGPGFKGDVKKGKPAGGSKGGSFKGGARKPFKAGGSSKPKQYLPIEKPVDEFLVQCKLMWNELREKQTTKERKRELVILLCKKLEGKVVDIVMKHDASRIVQTLVRLATAEEKLALMTELKGKFLELAKSKYGHQLIAKALRRGSPEVRALMTAEFRGQMSRLATHMIGAVIVEEGFARCWTGKESWELYQEFYGSEFIHFKAEQPTLQKIIAKDPSKASSIKNRLHSILTKQADKNLLSLTFVHRIMDDFFFLADPRTAVAAVPPFREAIVAMMSSRPGGRAAIKCLGYGSAKDRKVMLRSVKDNAAEAACHDQGHLVLVKALDVVDDTVLLRKSILDTLQDNLADIATDKYGRKLFLHLLARGNRHYFTPYDLKLLQAEQVPHPDTTVETPEHEIELVPSSKKDDDVRRGELLAVMKPVLTELCLTRMALLARNQWSAPLVLECLRRWRDPEIGQALADLLEDDVDHTAVEVAAARAVKSVSVAGTDAAKAHFGGGDSDDEEPAEDDDEEQGGSDDENDEEEEEEEGSESENDEAMPAAEAEAEEERLHILEHPPSHLLLKLLLKMEIAEGGNMFTVAPTLFPGEVSDQPEVDESAKSFAARMLEHMSGKLFDFAKLSNRSAFIVVALLESPTTAEATKMELMKHVDALKALEQNPGVRTMLQVLGVTKAPVKTPGKTPKRKRGDDGAAKTPARSAKRTPKRVGTPKTPDQSTGTVFTPDTGRRRSARTRQSTAKKQRK